MLGEHRDKCPVCFVAGKHQVFRESDFRLLLFIETRIDAMGIQDFVPIGKGPVWSAIAKFEMQSQRENVCCDAYENKMSIGREFEYVNELWISVFSLASATDICKRLRTVHAGLKPPGLNCDVL